MMAEDDSRGCLGLFGPLCQPNNVKIRPRTCFGKARLTVMLPGVEISLKSFKIKKNLFFKIGFSKLLKFRQDRCPDVFFGGSNPRNTPKIFQKPDFYRFSKNYDFYVQVNPLTRVETKTQSGSPDILLGKD